MCSRFRSTSIRSTFSRTSSAVSPSYSTMRMASGSPWTKPSRLDCSMLLRASSRMGLSVSSMA